MDRIGVSPAFVVSAYGPGFGAREYLAAVPRVASLGFRSLELEQYAPGASAEWNAASCASLARLMDDEGLEPSQFVAHFCLGDFVSRAGMERAACLEEFPRVVEACARFPRCDAVTIPLPAYLIAARAELSPAAAAGARERLIELLAKYLAIASSAGKRLALEIMPHALVGGTEGFLRLAAEDSLRGISYNFDTGHAWARKERIEQVPALLGDALCGTHICDNAGAESLKLGPGEGSIDFPALLAGLRASGYAGSLDLEILCAPTEVEERYRRAKAALERALAAADAPLAFDSRNPSQGREG